MILLDATQQLWLSSYQNQKKPDIHGLRDWITTGAYRIEQTPTKKNTAMLVDASLDVVEALSSDIVRYSSAAIESMHKLEAITDQPKATGWIVIRMYYAAYFAANTIMRFFGHFSVNLDQSQVAAVNEMARLYDISLPTSDKAKLSTGTYIGQYSASNGGVVVIRSLHTIGGGAHKQFWFAFKEFLDFLISDIKNCALTSPQKEVVKDILKALRETMCQLNNPNGGWLSEVRNAVNYRLEHGAWYPYAESKIEAQDLINLIQNRIDGDLQFKNLDSKLPELQICAATCTFLFSWMINSLERMSDQAKVGKKHFLTSVPLSLFQ
jgi:hypothetical protein